MRRARIGAFPVAWLVACLIVTDASLVLAQGAFGTLNGRVVDQGDAVLPGVTVTVTNVSTNVARVTVTNDEGLYNLPALEPGVYTIQTELAGFAVSTRTGVTLTINQTITVDFTMGVAGVNENITVSGTSPLIEATQSLVAATIRTREAEPRQGSDRPGPARDRQSVRCVSAHADNGHLAPPGVRLRHRGRRPARAARRLRAVL
jgi:hypothetical protein